MKRCLILMAMMVFSMHCLAVEPKVALEKVNIHLQDVESIKRGAKFFAANCMACHTMIYMRYDKLAQSQGVIYEKMPFNIKISGISPPDLSLITRIKSPDWVYTYLHSFYMDPKRPSGFNNLVFPETAMPNLLVSLQGSQILSSEEAQFVYHHQPRWFDLLVLQKQGAMTPEEFDATITDLVNFLAYAAEPYRVEQVQLGYWVIGFLLIFFIFAYLLKQAYWKDIKRHKKE